jgi:hypothetical protein
MLLDNALHLRKELPKQCGFRAGGVGTARQRCAKSGRQPVRFVSCRSLASDFSGLGKLERRRKHIAMVLLD